MTDGFNERLSETYKRKYGTATAAPAPAVEEIMRLADECIEKGHIRSKQWLDEYRAALRAAVEQQEQTIRERESELNAALDAAAHWGERAERAEREAAELQDLIWKFAGTDAADSVIDAAIRAAKEGK